MWYSGKRFSSIPHAIHKGLGFRTERLRKIYLRHHDIAIPVSELVRIRMIEIHVLAQDSFLIDPLIVNSDLLLGHVVIDNHFSGTYYDNFTYLLGVQPANVDVSNHLPRIDDVKKYHIVDSLLNEIH